MRTDSLILEITRQCNMDCDFCLRGDAEDLDMPEIVIRRALAGFKNGIGTLTFSGGEPTLNPDAIECAYECAKRRNIPIDAVFIATNGKIVTDRFLEICDRWHMYCMECSYGTQKEIQAETLETITKYAMQDTEYSGMTLTLSADEFHGPIPYRNLMKLVSRSYFSTSKYCTKFFREKGTIINMGRAGELLPQPRLRSTTPTMEFCNMGDGDDPFPETVYVSATGHIFPDCDLSYAFQEQHRGINVCDSDWKERLMQAM